MSDLAMASATAIATDIAPWRVRADLLGPGRSRRLFSSDLVEIGRALYGDPDLLSLYRVPAAEMDARWLKLVGRTAAECTVDRLCVEAAAAVARLVADARGPRRVVDLFAGSCNIAFHLAQAPNVVCHASELDPMVYRAVRHNLSLLEAPVHLHNADYRDLLGMLPAWGPNDVYVVDPPWRYGPSGRDLSRTAPALADVIENIRLSRAGIPFILLTTTDDAASRDVLRSALGAAAHVRTISAPATMPIGHNVQLHVYTCDAAASARLAG